MKHSAMIFSMALVGTLAAGNLLGVAGAEPRKGSSFQELDEDADGKVSLQEFTSKARFHRRSPEKMFSRFDVDRDGYLNKEEFQSRPFRQRGAYGSSQGN